MKEALLVIDVQNDVVKNAWNRDGVIKVIHEVINRARRKGILVVWVQHNDEGLIKNTKEWEIVPELVPLPSEAKIEKEWGNAFYDTPLKGILEQHQIEQVVLVGAQSDACIRMTKHGALELGYPVKLVTEGHTTESSRFDDVSFPGEWIVANENRMAMNTWYPKAHSELIDLKDLWI